MVFYDVDYHILTGFAATLTRRRRKRAIYNNNAPPMTKTKAEVLLLSYDMTFSGLTHYTEVTPKESGYFFNILEGTLMPGLCRNLVPQSAIEVNSKTAIIRIFRNKFVGISNARRIMSCSPCTGSVNETATVSTFNIPL